jgi:hypothetical protein
MKHVKIMEELHMYQKQPWTLEIKKKREVQNKKSKKVTSRKSTLMTAVINEMNLNPELTISTSSLMENFNCPRSSAFKCINELRKAKKIKLVNVEGEGTQAKAEYQSIKGSKETLKVAPKTGYTTISNFLKKKKDLRGATISAFRTYIQSKNIEGRVGMPNKRKIAVVYSVGILENAYSAFKGVSKVELKSSAKELSNTKISEKTKKEGCSCKTHSEKTGSFTIFGITLFNKQIGLTIQ